MSSGTNSTFTNSLTQRLDLSLVSKVYDPIGLVAPFTVGARLILKDIWRVNGQSWDDELHKDTVDRFLAWCAELPALAEIIIPRSYFSGPFQHLELHMFGDSSQDVFTAVGFLRAQVLALPRRLQQSWRLSWARPVLHECVAYEGNYSP